jgi:hypothetical protein
MMGTYETYDERVLRHHLAMRKRDCPRCGAPMGEACRWGFGPYVHPSRLRAVWESVWYDASLKEKMQ